jgi:hypothetical protein
MSDDHEELTRQIEALNYVDAMMKRVEAYEMYLASIPREEQTSREKLWLVAYEAVNEKMAPGTENSLREAALLLPILDDAIPTSQT